MLPPGIFLWESGLDEVVSPTNPETLSALHPAWAADIEGFAPWGDSFTIEGMGQFRKSFKLCETTIVVTGPCVSTMETARLLAEKAILSDWGAVIATEQSQGRGQLRRPWISPLGNLYASVVMPPLPSSGAWDETLENVLPLVAGYIFSEALGGMGADIRIKWPNDLLQDGRKVGGMLIEERNGLVVLGVGLNLAESPPDELMREDHSVPAAILQTNDRVLGALTLWETLVNRGKIMYVILLDEIEPPQFLLDVTKRLAWFGQRIVVRERGEDPYHAEIVGISPKGGLIIRRGEREVVLFSGSIFPQ